MTTRARTVMILAELDAAEETSVDRALRVLGDRVSFLTLAPGVRIGRAEARAIGLTQAQLAAVFEHVARVASERPSLAPAPDLTPEPCDE